MDVCAEHYNVYKCNRKDCGAVGSPAAHDGGMTLSHLSPQRTAL